MSNKVRKREMEYSGPISFLLALGVFSILLILKLGITIALAGAVGVFILGKALLKPRNKDKLMEGVSGYTEEMYREILQEGKTRYRKLRSLELRLEDQDLRKSAEKLNAQVKQILDGVEKDPRDIKPARRFFNYYLDSQIRILQGYLEIEGQKKDSALEKKGEVLSTLSSMEQAYGELQKKLLENDLLTLETEMAVLDQTIKMDGLHQERPENKE